MNLAYCTLGEYRIPAFIQDVWFLAINKLKGGHGRQNNMKITALLLDLVVVYKQQIDFNLYTISSSFFFSFLYILYHVSQYQ